MEPELEIVPFRIHLFRVVLIVTSAEAPNVVVPVVFNDPPVQRRESPTEISAVPAIAPVFPRRMNPGVPNVELKVAVELKTAALAPTMRLSVAATASPNVTAPVAMMPPGAVTGPLNATLPSSTWSCGKE